MRDDAYPSWQHLDDRARCAALRDGLLRYGRLLGWGARTVIVVTEQLARRPWKRCGRVELADVLAQLGAVGRAGAVRERAPVPIPVGRARKGGRRAHRA